MESKQKQEEEARTRAHQNEQRRYNAKAQNVHYLTFYLEWDSKLQAFMLKNTIAMRITDIASGLTLSSDKPLISIITAAHSNVL